MSELIFDTKKNNNQRRQAAFLALSPDQRVQVFLKMVSKFSKFETKVKPKAKGNFVLTKSENGV